MTVHYHFLDGTATGGQDFDNTAGSVTFYPDTYYDYLGAEVYVPVVDDDLAEYLERFQIELTSVDTADGWEWIDYGDGPVSTSEGRIIDNEPTVTIGATDTAAEANQTTGRFTIARSGGTIANPLAVQFSLVGSTAEASDYTLIDAHTNQPIGTTLTIPAGAYSNDVIVKPTDDTTPEWTETVTATLDGGSPAKYWFSLPSAATVQTVDNDFGFTLKTGVLVANYDDDNDNQVTDYNDTSTASGGDDDLYELKLIAPAIKPGTSVTVSLPPTRVNVYSSKNKTQKLLGDGSTDTLTFDTGHPLPQSLWVEVKAGSGAENDLVTLATSADNATRPSNGNKSQGNTAVNLIVGSGNDPNNEGLWVVTNKTRNWLIGQMANVDVYIQAPVAWQNTATYLWTVPATQTPLYGYDEANGNRTAIPLGNQHVVALAGGFERTGKTEPRVKFFWTATASSTNPDVNVVSVQVTANGTTLPAAKTTFKVYSPVVSNSAMAVGTSSLSNNDSSDAELALSGLALNGNATDQIGIKLDAAVNVPNGLNFQPGKWNFLQKVVVQRHRTLESKGQHPTNNGQSGLDEAFPYGGKFQRAPGQYGWGMVDPFDDNPNPPQNDTGTYTWTTGNNVHWMADKPAMPLLALYAPNDVRSFQDASINDFFRTWIMFLPSGQDSQWVPVMSADWTYYIGVTRQSVTDKKPHYIVNSQTQSATQFTPANEVPQWTLVHHFPFFEWVDD